MIRTEMLYYTAQLACMLQNTWNELQAESRVMPDAYTVEELCYKCFGESLQAFLQHGQGVAPDLPSLLVGLNLPHPDCVPHFDIVTKTLYTVLRSYFGSYVFDATIHPYNVL